MAKKKAASPRWNDLNVQDLEYIAHVLRKFAEADNGPEGHDGESYAYIAAETPKTPIWRQVFSSSDRVLLGHVVKQDLGYWSFEPAPADSPVEEF